MAKILKITFLFVIFSVINWSWPTMVSLTNGRGSNFCYLSEQVSRQLFIDQKCSCEDNYAIPETFWKFQDHLLQFTHSGILPVIRMGIGTKMSSFCQFSSSEKGVERSLGCFGLSSLQVSLPLFFEFFFFLKLN